MLKHACTAKHYVYGGCMEDSPEIEACRQAVRDKEPIGNTAALQGF